MERIRLLPLVAALTLPGLVLAQTGETPGTGILVLYAAIGFFGAVSFGVFVWGFSVYITRLGLERREEGIKVMEWSITIMVVVIILIGILRFFQG